MKRNLTPATPTSTSSVSSAPKPSPHHRQPCVYEYWIDVGSTIIFPVGETSYRVILRIAKIVVDGLCAILMPPNIPLVSLSNHKNPPNPCRTLLDGQNLRTSIANRPTPERSCDPAHSYRSRLRNKLNCAGVMSHTSTHCKSVV